MGSAKWFSFAGLIVFGLVLADVLKNPNGTKAAASGFRTASTPVINGLLGQTS